MTTTPEPHPLANIHPSYFPVLLAELNATALNFDTNEQMIYTNYLLAQMAKFPAPGEPEQPATLPLIDPAAPGVTERVLLALMTFLNRVKEYRESQSWKVTAQYALKAAQELEDGGEEDQAQYALARYARQRGQHTGSRNTDADDDGFSGMMTPFLDSPTTALERELEAFMDSAATRSFAATRKGGNTSPDWKGEHDKHPSRRNAWVLGHVLTHLVLHGLQKIGHNVKHKTLAHWSHALHGAAERAHPGAEPQVTRTTGKK